MKNNILFLILIINLYSLNAFFNKKIIQLFNYLYFARNPETKDIIHILHKSGIYNKEDIKLILKISENKNINLFNRKKLKCINETLRIMNNLYELYDVKNYSYISRFIKNNIFISEEKLNNIDSKVNALKENIKFLKD